MRRNLSGRAGTLDFPRGVAFFQVPLLSKCNPWYLHFLLTLSGVGIPYSQYLIRGESCREKIMKNFIRPALLALLVLVFSGAAFADDIHVIFDPQPATVGSFNLIQSTGVEYTVNWGDCTQPVFATTGFSGDAACLAFINQTGAAIGSLNFTFTVNAALVGQTIACDNAPDDTHLDGNDCASTPGPFTLGQVVDVNFFGGDPIPNGFAFYIAENGVALADAPTVGVEVPEPASMTLLASGMGLLGLALVLTKR
jgi:hypothetical protein